MNYTFQAGYLLFEKKLDALFNRLQKKLRLGIACSGGPDSVLALEYIYQYRKKYIEKIDFLLIIHIVDGHELIDQSLMGTMQKAYNLIIAQSKYFLIEHVMYRNVNAEKFNQKISIETLCHQIRKEFFNEAKNDFKLDRIITGHCLTDQLEHFFIGIIRHSSLKRISGMKEDSSIYLRPLLFINKNNIKDILDDNNIEYVLDPCNNNNYLRNNLRILLLPLINTIDSRFELGIMTMMNQLSLLENYIDELVLIELQKKQLFYIPYFLELNITIAYKIIEKIYYQLNCDVPISISMCAEIMRFLKTKQGGKHILHTITIIKKNNHWHMNLIV